MGNQANTKAPIVNAVGTVRNPPHGQAWLPAPEAKAEGAVEPPRQDNG